MVCPVNEEHLARCSSAEWAEAVQRWITARLEAAGFTAVHADTNDYAMRFRATKPPAPRPAS